MAAHPERVEGCSEFHDRNLSRQANVMQRHLLTVYSVRALWSSTGHCVRRQSSSQEKTRQSSHLQRRLYDHGLAAFGGEGLGHIQRQWSGRGVDRHEPVTRGGSAGARRYRLCRRRRAGVRRRDIEWFAVAGDLVFLGSESRTGCRARRTTKLCRISKAKRSPSREAWAAPTMWLC